MTFFFNFCLKLQSALYVQESSLPMQSNILIEFLLFDLTFCPQSLSLCQKSCWFWKLLELWYDCWLKYQSELSWKGLLEDLQLVSQDNSLSTPHSSLSTRSGRWSILICRAYWSNTSICKNINHGSCNQQKVTSREALLNSNKKRYWIKKPSSDIVITRLAITAQSF